jgi:tRNA-splicing endonuclease subunit Sen54
MADADEDAFPLSSHATSSSTSRTQQAPDTDPTDEAQDFRFLSSINSRPSAASPNSPDPATEFTIPRRGEKDFEPLPFLSSQTAALDASRAAMQTALSAPRVHSGKSHLVGVFVGEAPKGLRGRRGVEGRCVCVKLFRGPLARTIGMGDARNRTWLWPEEALFLVERGSLDVRWPRNGGGEEVKGGGDETKEEDTDEWDEGIPMSLQAAYASLMGKSGLTLERYLVFAGLRRLGYILTRAPTWNDDDVWLNGHARQPESTQDETQNALTTPTRPASGIVGAINKFLQRLFAPPRGVACPSLGPLVAPGLYRNYNDIFRALVLVPYYDSVSSSLDPQAPKPQPKPPFRIVYNVWKPNSPYRKTSPPDPDFRIAVIDARSSSVPTVQQIGALLDSLSSDELPKDKRVEQRLKHGKKNVILAVVDSGVVSYLRLSETGFGSVKLFEEKTSRGGKKGGKGKGKGR